MALDSDINNADAHLTVEFYEYDRQPYLGVPFIKIMTPGDQLNIIDRPAKEHDQRRFPHHWHTFQMNRDGHGIIGTVLSQWNLEDPASLNRDQLTELQILKFQTVEQVANATDAQLQRVGMGGVGLREKARRFLTRQNMDAHTGEIDDLKAQIAELKAMLTEPKNKGGRPKKVTNVSNNDAAIGAAGNQ